MSEKMIKWGFIGCGEVTKTKSGPAFQKVEHSEVVAVMSRDGAKAKAYAKERGIKKWYDDAQELIDDPEVNAIYIATPPSSHATYAIMSMKAGKPAYIEKPMAVTYEECTRINRISNETGVPCFVAYYRRYLPYFQKVKELVENGTIGNIINVQIRFAQPPRDLDYNRDNLPWRVQADIAGGGYFYDLAPHQIDLLQDMFEHILQQINLMRSKVVEVATSGNVSLHTPGKVVTIVIQIAWRLGKTNLHIDNITDSTVLYQFLYFLEIGEITAIVSNETGNSRFIGYAVDARAFFVRHSHWFLNIGRFACFHGHNGIRSM